MLELYNILWVIPGVIFINLYNRKRPSKAISLSGWPYLFFLVVIATLTWLPASLMTFELFDIEKKLINQSIILCISIVFMFFLLYITQWEFIAKIIFLPAEDNFYKKCVEWENEEIVLSLKNGKAYYGVLWKYPDNPKSRHESQTISIIPCISGYRDEATKQVIWSTYYPEYKNKTNFIGREMIIPRSEILTFTKFNKEIFEHFYKNANK